MIDVWHGGGGDGDSGGETESSYETRNTHDNNEVKVPSELDDVTNCTALQSKRTTTKSAMRSYRASCRTHNPPHNYFPLLPFLRLSFQHVK